MNVRLAIPLLIQEGWLRHQEKDAKPPQRRRRGGWDCRSVSECVLQESVPCPTTPSAPSKEASRLLLDVASTPPMSGGECRAQFIRTSFDRAFQSSFTRSATASYQEGVRQQPRSPRLHNCPVPDSISIENSREISRQSRSGGTINPL